MKAQVYSYRRFSSAQQKDGTSIQRQSDYADQVAEEYGLELNTDLIMTDEGLSAFHAEHVTKGALGIFIKAVEAGLVASGSILIVESLDRLSREAPLQAQLQFNDLISKGITLITGCDKQVYNIETLSREPAKLFISVAIMLRSHEESLTKQRRSVDFIKQQIRAFEQEGKSKAFTATPFWIDKTDGGFELNDKEPIIRLIVDYYLNNKSIKDIILTLSSQGIPSPRKGHKDWRRMTVKAILKNKALFGLKVCSLKYLKDGRPIEENYELENYYPPVITESEYLLIQDRFRRNTASRESYGNSTYLLSSYGKNRALCSKCGCTVICYRQKRKDKDGFHYKDELRLSCRNQRESYNGCASFNASELEKAFIRSIVRHLDGRFLAESPEVVKQQRSEAVIGAQLSDIEERIDNLIETLSTVKQVKTKAQIQSKLLSLEEQKAALEEQQKASKLPVLAKEEYDRLKELAYKAMDVRNDQERRLLKQMLLQVIDKIHVDFSNKNMKVVLFDKSTITFMFDKNTGEYRTIGVLRSNASKSRLNQNHDWVRDDTDEISIRENFWYQIEGED